MVEKNENDKRELLLDELRKELERLLCSDALSEEEKLCRISRAQEIIEIGVE